MPLSGHVLMPREIAAACYGLTPWRNYELTKAIGTALGEASGSIGAWHDNLQALLACSKDQEVCNPETLQHMIVLDPAEGKVKLLPDNTIEYHPPESEVVVSRDCGLFEINIPAAKIGSPLEESLRTESMDETVWRPVLENNIAAALALYQEPWNLNGTQRLRLWEAWVSYTSGWVLFPEWWVWHQDQDKNPVGPWLATGRFIQRAIVGQMNFHVVIKQDWTAQIALSYAQRYCKEFGVDPSLLYVRARDGTLSWHVPPKPDAPPADGVGPRPIPNSGI